MSVADKPRKLLVIRLGAMGDLLHMSASLAAIRAEQPDLEVHVLTAPAYRELVTAMAGVDTVWTFDKRHPWQEIARLVPALRQAGITHVANLHPSLKTWLLTQSIAPTRQATYHKQKRFPRGAAQRSMPRRHAVADFYEPLRKLLALPESPKLTPRLSVGIEKPVSPQIALIPGVGAQRGNRAWPAESYARLIALLGEQVPASRIVLVGGPEDRPLAQALIASNPAATVENHCGTQDILGTAQLLAKCSVVVGGDTGPLHLAAAVGAPIVAIFGPTSLARTGPVGKQPIRRQTPPEALSCWPCEHPTCPLSGEEHLACMRDIPVETVTQACMDLLNR